MSEMQKEMVPVFVPVGVDFGAQAPDLLSQLDRLIPDAVYRDAAAGFKFLSGLRDEPAEVQAEIVSKLGLSNLAFDRGDMTSSTIAVVSAALAMVSKCGNLNPSERVGAAMDLLAERYQADW